MYTYELKIHEALESFDKIHNCTSKMTEKIRLKYHSNFSVLLYNAGKYKHALEQCNEAFKILNITNLDSTYFLDEFNNKIKASIKIDAYALLLNHSIIQLQLGNFDYSLRELEYLLKKCESNIKLEQFKFKVLAALGIHYSSLGNYRLAEINFLKCFELCQKHKIDCT